MAVTNSVNPPDEAQREAATADLNKSVGWIPVLGTVYNAVNLVADFMSFTVAALEGNGPDMADEIGDMATDVVGMIPLVGGALASEIYHLRVPSTPSKVTGPEIAGTWTITSMTADLLDGSGPAPQPVTGTIAVAKAGDTYTVTTTGTNTDTGETVTQPLGTLTEAASGTYTGALSTDQINATAQLLQSKIPTPIPPSARPTSWSATSSIPVRPRSPCLPTARPLR